MGWFSKNTITPLSETDQGELVIQWGWCMPSWGVFCFHLWFRCQRSIKFNWRGVTALIMNYYHRWTISRVVCSVCFERGRRYCLWDWEIAEVGKSELKSLTEPHKPFIVVLLYHVLCRLASLLGWVVYIEWSSSANSFTLSASFFAEIHSWSGLWSTYDGLPEMR